MFATAIRLMAKKPKPKMKPIEPKMPPERTQSLSRSLYEVIKEHGPITISDAWNRVKEADVGLRSKNQMKILLRWMRQRQKLRQVCNHVGKQKQFLYTTWFTSPRAMPPPRTESSSSRSRSSSLLRRLR